MFTGYYADGKFGTEPIFLLIGLVLGGAAGIRRLLKIGPGSSTGLLGESDSADSSDPAGRETESASTGDDPGHDGKGNG